MPSSDFSLPAVRRAWARRLREPRKEADWENLARELFGWQWTRVPAYRRLCEGHGVTPQNLPAWREIPAVPQQLFKLERLFSHGARAPGAIYETSGTTTGQPGRQYLLRPDLYQAMATEGADRIGLFDGEPEFHFLVPSPAETPHSSLSAMFGFWKRHLGRTGPRFWVRRGKTEFDALRKMLLGTVQSRRPVALAGTAFSFVHLIDAWENLPPLRLPAGSRLLETGGFKGRSREVSKEKLYRAMARLFAVPDTSIWNEYGMSELSSQAYARGISGEHRTPPWARVLVCDPATNREVRPGRRGLVRWYDLANIDSVFALQTLDLAERTATGFRLIGRLSRTEPRGCSLSAEDLTAASPGAGA